MRTVTGILVLNKKKVRPRSQAVRIRIRVRLGSGDGMSTSECLGMSVMSGYGRIRSENDLLDQTFCDRTISKLLFSKLTNLFSWEQLRNMGCHPTTCCLSSAAGGQGGQTASHPAALT